jgi:hypothetical protein
VQVFVSGCDNSTSDKCLLEIGTNQTITIKFSEYFHFVIILKVIATASIKTFNTNAFTGLKKLNFHLTKFHNSEFHYKE